MLSMKLMTSTAFGTDFPRFQVSLPYKMVFIFSAVFASDYLKAQIKPHLNPWQGGVQSIPRVNQFRQNYKISIIVMTAILQCYFYACEMNIISNQRVLWLDLATYLHPPFLWVLGRFARL